MEWLKKRNICYPALAAALAALMVMTWALLIPPVMGLGDNGDFSRVMNGLGIYKLDQGEPDAYFSYANHEFGLYEYHNEFSQSMLTTQTPLILLAKGLDYLFTGDDARFDVRFLAVILMLYLAAGLYMLVDYVANGENDLRGYLMAALAVFTFADVGYILYFNSFYAEGLSFASFLSLAGALLLLSQRRRNPRALLWLVFINGLILTGAKQQNAPTGLVLAALLPLLCWLLTRGAREGAGKARLRRLSYVLAGLLAASGVVMYVMIPQVYVDINKYHAMTRGVLMTADDPEASLDDFAISSQFAVLNKTTYYDEVPIVSVDDEVLEEDFYQRYGYFTILTYYITHPDRFVAVADTAAQNAYLLRSDMMGNYARADGYAAGQRTNFFSLHSDMLREFAPRSAGFIALWMLLTVALSWRDHGRTLVLGFLVLLGFSQLAVSVIGAGDADLSKHVFLYNAAFDLVNYIGICCGLGMIWKLFGWWKERKVHPLPPKREEEGWDI